MLRRPTMGRGQKALRCEGIGQRLKRTRKDQDLSLRKLGEMAGLGVGTAQMIEDGKSMPQLDTAERLSAALGVSSCWLCFGVEPIAAFNCWLAPDFNPVQMHERLQELLSGPGGHIEQSYKYMDAAGAANWLHSIRQADYTAYIESMPLDEIAKALREAINTDGCNIVGLGAGTARHEARLVHYLTDGDINHIRLFLLDISQPLLAAGLAHARETFGDTPRVSLWGIQGDFHRLASYGQALASPRRQRTVYCMFGLTFGNLDNEIRFIQNSLTLVKKGDFLLIDLSAARADADQPDEVLSRDPAFSNKRPVELKRRLDEFVTEPIRRFYPDLQIKVEPRLNTACCVIPGSYAVDIRATLPDGRQFSVAYVKRYHPERLAAHLATEGWEPVALLPYSKFNPSVLALFAKR